MAAVHAAIRLVSPIETTIHSGEIISLLPGKSGTINLFLNSEILKEKNTNAKFKADFDSFIESFGDEFKGQEPFKKFVLVRTGAHFRFPGDKQFVTVVYSGSGRMVFNFDSDSHTNPMQKLYVEGQPGGIVVTNKAQNGAKNNFHFGYSLFDIPACTSEIQTDILVDLSLVTPLGSAPAGKRSAPPSTPPPSLTDDEEKNLANYFLTYANSERKLKGSSGDIDAVIQTLKNGNLIATEPQETFVKKLSLQFDLEKDGYDIYDQEAKGLKHISIDDYKQTIQKLQKNKQYFKENKAKLNRNDDPLNNQENRIALAAIILGLPKDCIPEELLREKLPTTNDQQNAINLKIRECDQMRVPQNIVKI